MFSIILMMGSTKLLTVMLVIHFISNKNISSHSIFIGGTGSNPTTTAPLNY
jgi:hypothetical protein